MADADEPSRQHWLVIANPAAGSVDEAAVAEVVEACREHGADVTVRWTKAPGHAGELAVADYGEPPAVVLPIGGDGTTREVAQALGAAGSPAAVLTTGLGTGNSFHRALWGDVPWRDAVAARVGGSSRVRRVDLMRIAGADRSALLGASTGFIADVTEMAAGQRGVAGRERYMAAIGDLAAAPLLYPGRVTVDGRVLFEGDVLTATVGGARHRVGIFQILPESVLDDGLLDVCVIAAPASPEARDELIPHVLQGTHVGLPGVFYARGETVVLERLDGRPPSFEHDGEVWRPPGGSVTLETHAGAVAVVAPERPVAG